MGEKRIGVDKLVELLRLDKTSPCVKHWILDKHYKDCNCEEHEQLMQWCQEYWVSLQLDEDTLKWEIIQYPLKNGGIIEDMIDTYEEAIQSLKRYKKECEEECQQALQEQEDEN